MKQTILFLFFSHFVLICFAGRISGIVTDNEGAPLSYSSILVKGTSKGTNANSEGKYSLNLEPGQYTIVCQHVGYKKEEKEITVRNEDS